MSVGGWIIQSEDKSKYVTELWVVDRDGTETCVAVETDLHMPQVGDEIWWQSGKVYWDGDRRELRKVGYTYDPQRVKV